MSFTRSTTNVDVHKNMPDYPSSEGYTAAQLKTAFDSSAVGLKADLNGLMTELEDTSSASNIGASAVTNGDSSNTNVQAKLEYIMEQVQGAVLGDIPDGTITQEKLNATYEETIAKKDGTLQTGLNTELLNGKTEAQLMASFIGTSNPTTLSFTSLAAPSTKKATATATETKTLSTNGNRYYVMLFSYNACKVALYDAQTGKFVFATYLGNHPEGGNGSEHRTFAFNTNQIALNTGYYAQGNHAELRVTYSEQTLTFVVNKSAYRDTDDHSKEVPAGTITVFELCSMVQ